MRRLAAILLISLLALASIGLKINAHVCQGSIKSIGVFVPAQSCSTMASGSCTKLNYADGYNKTPCCTDKCFASPQSLFESVEFIHQQPVQQEGPVEFKSPLLLTTNLNAFVLNEYEDDPPDRQVNKVQVLFQVFRI